MSPRTSGTTPGVEDILSFPRIYTGEPSTSIHMCSESATNTNNIIDTTKATTTNEKPASISSKNSKTPSQTFAATFNSPEPSSPVTLKEAVAGSLLMRGLGGRERDVKLVERREERQGGSHGGEETDRPAEGSSERDNRGLEESGLKPKTGMEVRMGTEIDVR